MPSHSPIYDLTVKVLQPLAAHLPTSLIRWEAGVTPLSDLNVVVAAMVTYLITIFSLRAYINNLKAQKKAAEQASGNKKSTAANTAEKGKNYMYIVTALDRLKNESSPVAVIAPYR